MGAQCIVTRLPFPQPNLFRGKGPERGEGKKMIERKTGGRRGGKEWREERRERCMKTGREVR